MADRNRFPDELFETPSDADRHFAVPDDRTIKPPSGTKALSVSELTRQVRLLLESQIGDVVVEGEISNWRLAASGHAYFVLKDSSASIRCVMFRSAAMRLDLKPRDGMQVEVRGRLSVYEARGEYQIVVEKMVEQGLGALFEAFLRLKEKLEKEGLFDPVHKQPLPFLPQRVGVVTSPTGAAIRDILNVLGRRFANLHVFLWPVRVQGEGAAAEIAHALRSLDRLGLVDVIICGRGGGSIEDLWAFNEESVARAIFDCRTPVISAVGHEIDFTIADFVADLRAPTPSAAAELVIANQVELLDKLRTIDRRLDQAVIGRVRYLKSVLEGLLQSYALEEPRHRLRQLMQRTDDLMVRLEQQTLRHFARERDRLGIVLGRLHAAARSWMRAVTTRLEDSDRRLQRAAVVQTRRIESRLDSLRGRLETLSPQATLERGYSIVQKSRTGEVVRSPRQTAPNEPLDIHTAGGLLPARAAPPIDARQGDLFGETE